jgi:hypothetical protein
MRPYVEGAFIGFMIAVWVFNSPWSDNTKYRNAIHECQKTLPRDQHCKVIGVPE